MRPAKNTQKTYRVIWATSMYPVIAPISMTDLL